MLNLQQFFVIPFTSFSPPLCRYPAVARSPRHPLATPIVNCGSQNRRTIKTHTSSDHRVHAIIFLVFYAMSFSCLKFPYVFVHVWLCYSTDVLLRFHLGINHFLCLVSSRERSKRVSQYTHYTLVWFLFISCDYFMLGFITFEFVL